MGSKELVLSGLILIIAISGCIFNPDNKKDDQNDNIENPEIGVNDRITPTYGNYWFDFIRNYSNQGEREAIENAENEINYTHYMKVSRFQGDRANYIDSQVLNYYNDSLYNAINNSKKVDMSYYYFANAKFHPELSGISFIRGSAIFEINGTKSYPLNSNNITFNEVFKEVYLVDMELSFSEVWGPYSGYKFNTHQLIIMDKNYTLKLIILFPKAIVVY